MCGIFGVLRKPHSAYSLGATNNNEILKGLFCKLAFRSMSRGTDSTGAVLIRKHRTVSWSTVNGKRTELRKGGMVFVAKDKTPADKFITGTKYLNLVENVDNHALGLVGHTRASSSAVAYNNANNHPHVCGKVVGVHNGHIINWKEIVREYKLKMNGKCDSEVIFRLIDLFLKKDNINVREAIQKTSSIIQGSYACALVISDEVNNVYLFRKEAPIKIRHKSFGNLILFASSNAIIREAYKDMNLESTHSKGYYELNEYMLPNGHGLVLNSETKDHMGWIKEVDTFRLDQ
ncbi:MAG: hypothetical protein KAS32_03720 [Candidatus Peribacteraceae bacterium]|nr:hypothetical protein [Candidatus Peribacteraceae bacterium]